MKETSNSDFINLFDSMFAQVNMMMHENHKQANIYHIKLTNQFLHCTSESFS